MDERKMIMVTADATLPVRAAASEFLDCEAPATPEGHPIKLTDECGREIGTAVVVDGRIHAKITDQMTIRRLRSEPAGISMGYRVVVAQEPAVRAAPTEDPVELARRAEIAKLAVDSGIGERWAQDLIDAGCTIEEARDAAFRCLLRR